LALVLDTRPFHGRANMDIDLKQELQSPMREGEQPTSAKTAGEIDLKQELETMRAIFQQRPVDYWALGSTQMRWTNTWGDQPGAGSQRGFSEPSFRRSRCLPSTVPALSLSTSPRKTSNGLA